MDCPHLVFIKVGEACRNLNRTLIAIINLIGKHNKASTMSQVMPDIPGSYYHTTEGVVGTFQPVDLKHDRILQPMGEPVRKPIEGIGCRGSGVG